MDHGQLTSPTLLHLLRHAVAEQVPSVASSDLDKVGLLEAATAHGGWRMAVRLGQRIRTLGTHPVIGALIADREPRAIVERWLRLERFGHSRNRTRVLAIEASGGGTTLTLRHEALDGGAIVPVNDLFMWGVFIGLMEAAGVEGLVADLLQEEPRAELRLHGGATDPTAPLPPRTHTLRLRGRAGPPSRAGEVGRGSLAERLGGLLGDDLLHGWSVADAARALGTSSRSLQRALRQEGTTFSATLQRVRVDAARALIPHEDLTLGEIAFCVGFSDQGHFTRVFRQLCDVPPSALREIVGPT